MKVMWGGVVKIHLACANLRGVSAGGSCRFMVAQCDWRRGRDNKIVSEALLEDVLFEI